MSDCSTIEDALGLAFVDKSLLQRALVHRSYLNEHPEFGLEDNERLEFLGDAVLDFLTGEYLYHRFPELPEGPLTSLRSVLVRRDTLADFARQFSLGAHLLMGLGEASSGGRERPAILCAAFEALVGALYLDRGLETVRELLAPLIAPKVAQALREQLDKDHKSRLQELAQSVLHQTPRYSTVEETGPEHAKTFTVQVLINGQFYGRGVGRSKQEAEQQAAHEAFNHLEATCAAQTTPRAQSAPPDHPS
jgi:ribonuclease-3